MAKVTKIEAPGLDKLIQGLENREAFIQSQDEREIDLSREKTFVSGPFLHQGTEGMSEEQSAQFEVENKELFRWLRSFANQIKNIINV